MSRNGNLNVYERQLTLTPSMSGTHQGLVWTLANEDVCPNEKAAVTQLQSIIAMATCKLVVRSSHF